MDLPIRVALRRLHLSPEILTLTTPRGELIEMQPRYAGCMRAAAVPVITRGLVFAGGGDNDF